MSVTMRHFLGKKTTVQYPEQRLPMSPRFKGRHVFFLDLCIGCTACERICPVLAIRMDVHRNPETRKLAVDKFDVDLGTCYYCGLCEEVCPTEPKSVVLGQEFELATYDRQSLVWDMHRLAPEPGMTPESAKLPR
jgi:NADH-quinone oxidoreductase chain I